MNDSPRTGDGYRESEETKKDVILDMRMKQFQADFAKETPKVSVKDIIRNPFRKGKS